MMNATQFHWPRRVERLCLIAIVLVAIVFRFAQFTAVPPGLHYDEAIDAHLAQEIRSGAWPIYFEEGWGREPLYHYLVAATLNFVPEPASALRLVSGLLGLIQLLAAYLLFRKLFGVPTALLGAAWIAVMFWTVSTSRAGLRNITLTTLATLTALAFWYVWDRQRVANGKRLGATTHSALSLTITNHQSPITNSLITNHQLPIPSLVLPGFLLGLTLYTYQPSRVVPLIYLVFMAYVFWRERVRFKTNWKSMTVFFGVAAVIASPLIYFLVTHPDAETARAFQTEPLRAMLHGDLGPVIDTTTSTLKMFTFEGGGDPQPIYNIVGRPLFMGLGSILFYVGLIVCVIRWKQPQYAFVLIWLIVTLLPNMLTAPAPFFYRAIAAQTPTLVLPAIATVALGGWMKRGVRRARGEKTALSWRFVAVIAITFVSVGQTAVTTWHDYFDVWGRDKEVRFQYSAAQTEIAQALDASNAATPAIISGYFIEDSDPYVFDQTLQRRDLSIRWFDAQSALVVVSGATDQRIALPSFAPLDEALQARFLSNTQPITQAKDFKIYPFDAAAFQTVLAGWTCSVCPVAFDGEVELLGIDRPVSISRTAETLTVWTAWRILREGQPSLTKIFVHVLDAKGNLIPSQDDRLGYPRHGWHPGDEFVQLQHISIANLPPGQYTLELGVYTSDGGRRWTAQDQSGRVIGDHVALGGLEVKP